MQYTETELNKLIETVEKEFTDHLTKAEDAHKATLAKSEGSAAPLVKAEDKPADKKDAPPSDKKDAAPEKQGDDKPADKKDAAPAPADGEAKPEGKEAAPAAAPAEGAPAQADAGHGYDDQDMEHMQKMYMSMSKGELKAHHDCIMEIAKADMGQAAPAPAAAPAQEAAPAAPQGGDMGKSEPKSHAEANGGQISATGEPKDPPGAKSPASKAEGMQMSKSETNTEVEMLKSELASEKAKSDTLKKNQDALQEFLTKLVKKVPQGKAITSLDVIAKSESGQETQELTKSEVTSILMKKASDPTLSKSDRDAINAFYISGTNYNTISHLLKN